MLRKTLASMVALSMMVGLAACGSSAGGGSGATTAATTAAATEAPAPAGEAPAGASPTFKIGYNYFGSASYTLMTLANNSGDTLKALDVEYIASDDKFSLEQLVTDVENMIAAGCDGLVLWLPTDTLYATVTEMCKEAQVPFVLNDKLPMDESLIAQISENPYFVGAFGVKNAQYGVALANYVLEQGWKACFITSSNVGDVSDTERMDAFKGIFEAAGGKVFTELHASSSDEALPQIEDALTAYGEQIDFIYGVGGDFGNAACSALENYKGGESGLKVITTGIDQGTLDNFDAGTIAMVNGDYFVNGIVSVIAMVNYLEGNHLVDASGKSPWIYNTASIDINADTNAVFRKVFTQRLCYSDDELRNMTYAYNAGFKYADLEAAIMNYSFSDRVAAAVKAGVITADEAAGAGVK